MITISRSKYLGVVVFVLILGGVHSGAEATLIHYDYDGNNFIDQNYFPANDKITGFIEVDTDQLPGGTIANQTITFGDGNLLQIPSWSFTDGNRTFNNIIVGLGNFLGFTTDGSGDIDEWYFFVGISLEIMSGKSDTTANLLDDFCCSTSFIPFGDESLGIGEFARNTANPGTWTREVMDEELTIPEPSTIGLFAIGLIGLGVISVRRRKEFEAA